MLTQTTMTDRAPRQTPPPPEDLSDPLLSDEPTLELVVRARAGDRAAVEACCSGAFRRSNGGRT